MLESRCMTKERLDKLLVERGIVESREKGRRVIMAGQVRVYDQVVDKPGTLIDVTAAVQVVELARFVGRGGEKLLAAIRQMDFNIKGKVCADVGASTGGFTDCLLQHDATRVYAIDVGKGLLHWRLRNDPRVVLMEKTNARYVERLPEAVSLVTIDASFISLEKLLPVVSRWLVPHTGCIVALIKPQFEAGRERVGKGGVVRDPAVHRDVLRSVIEFAIRQELRPLKIIPSPLRGPAGNVEFFALLCQSGDIPEIDELTAVRYPSEWLS